MKENKSFSNLPNSNWEFKLDTLEEIDKFLEIYNLTRLNRVEIESLSRFMSKETTAVINSLPTKKNPIPDGFTGDFSKHLEFVTLLSNFSKQLKRKEHFYLFSMSWI